MTASTPTRFALEPLARALSQASPAFLVWKGGRSVAEGGDLDAAAPASAHDRLVDAFDAWTRADGLAATVVCTHGVGMTILVGCGGIAGDRLLQVDVIDRKLVHGAPVWSADLLRTAVEASDGVRRLRPGAEGVARVLANRSDEDGAELARADPAGARSLAQQLGLAGSLATRTSAASRAALGGVLIVRAVLSPRSVLRSVRTDRSRRRCPVLRALQDGRRLPDDLEAWLDTVARTHEVRRA